MVNCGAVNGNEPANLLAWTGGYLEYHEFGGFRVPCYVEVSWLLPEGEFTYAPGNIDLRVEIEYDPLLQVICRTIHVADWTIEREDVGPRCSGFAAGEIVDGTAALAFIP